VQHDVEEAINETSEHHAVVSRRLRSEGARATYEAVKSNASLTSLRVSRHKMGDAGARAVAEAATAVPLLHVDVSDALISATGAEALAEILNGNANLQSLYISGNLIGDRGARALSSAVCSSSLHALNVSRNSIGDKGATQLTDAAAAGCALSVLSIEGNKLGDDSIRSMHDALMSSSSTVQTLDIRSNCFSSDRAVQLFKHRMPGVGQRQEH